MGKRDLSEEDIKAQYITPAIESRMGYQKAGADGVSFYSGADYSSGKRNKQRAEEGTARELIDADRNRKGTID